MSGRLRDGKALLEQLKQVVTDPRDIEQVLRSAAGGSVSGASPGYVTFDTNDPEPKTFARARMRGGAITELTVGEPLASDEVRSALIERARDESALSHGSSVFRRLLFARHRISGAFRWRDAVQLRACSPDVVIDQPQTWRPEPEPSLPKQDSLGPPFPLMLEVRVPLSPNAFIEASRKARCLQWWQDVLAVFVPGDVGFWSPGPQRIWTFQLKDGVARNRLVEPGFSIGEEGESDDFSTADLAELRPADGFYDRLWFQNSALEFPASLPNDLALLDSLTPAERAAFARAAYWFSVGQRTRSDGQGSLAVTAFSAAIESLLPRVPPDRCATCHRETGQRTTFFFRQHLHKYAPVSESLRKRQSEIYKMRSALVHGSHLPEVDLDFWSMPGDYPSRLLLEWNARVGLINWVRAPDRSTWHPATGSDHGASRAHAN